MHAHFHTGARALRIVFELMLVSLCVLLVLLLAGVLRLRHGPVDASFARAYIERSLSTPGPDGFDVAVDELTLSWPHLGGAVVLDMTNMQLRQNGQLAGTVDHVRLGLSRVLLLAGRVSPVAIALERPSLRLVRQPDNHIAMSLQPSPDAETAPKAPDAFAGVIRAIAGQGKLFDLGSPLALLKRFDIDDASLTVDDQVAGNRWRVDHADMSFVHNRAGMDAAARLRVPGGRHGEAVVDASAIYRRASNDYTAHARLANFDPALIARQAPWLNWLAAQDMPLNGDVDGVLDADLMIRRARLTMAAGAGNLVLPSLFTRPLPVSGLGIEASYDHEKQTLDINRLTVRTGGVEALLGGHFSLADGRLQGRATLTAPFATQADVAGLWPDALPGGWQTGGAQAWLTRKLSRGVLKNITASVNVAGDLRFDQPPRLTLSGVVADFDAAGMTVDYCPPLSPATEAEWHGRFADGALDIAVQGARIGEVRATGGRVLVTGLPGAGVADVTLQLAGPAQSALAYVASPPLGIDANRIGFDLKNLRGTVAANVHIRFPTNVIVNPDQVHVAVDGTLDQVVLPGAVRGADLAADQLTLRATNDGASLAGTGTLGGAPLTFSWQKTLGLQGEARIVADIVTDNAFRAKLGVSPAIQIDGRLPVHLEYASQASGPATAAVRADAGNAALVVAPLDYRKAAGAAASAAATLDLEDGQLRAVHDITITAPNFIVPGGNATFVPDGNGMRLETLALPRLRLNETDVAMDLTLAKDGTRNLKIHGAFLDAQPFLHRPAGSPPYRGPPVQGTVSVASLRGGPDGVLKKTELRFATNDDGMLNSFDLRGAAGAGVVAARLGPGAHGGRDLLITASDAGAALQIFDLYPNIKGGRLEIHGHADAATPRAIDGQATLSDFTVVHAPVLASILTALSITSLPSMLASDGIHFSSLESDFTWKAGDDGSLFSIRDGRSTGASLGLTFSGTVDTVNDRMDIGGDVVPFSGINGLLNNVPILDNILSGGKHGGIFAATYSITGPPSTPDVSVNPLAALAPGFLRPLLFGH